MNSKDIVKNLFTANSIFPFKSTYRGGDILLIAAWLLFSYTVFSGAVRKWAFGPGAVSNVIFFIQLLIPFIFFQLIALSKAPSRFKAPLILLIFIVYLIVAAFNAKNHTIYHGLFGLVIHLGIWVGLISYFKRRDFFEIEKLAGFLILVLLVEVFLASAQNVLPGDHPLNTNSEGNIAEAIVGDSIRVSGTFSFLGGFQAMVTFYGFFIWFLVVLRFPPALIITVFWLTIYLGLINGSRTAMGMVLGLSFFSFFFTGFLFKNLLQILLNLSILAVLIFYFGDNLTTRFEKAYSNFEERVSWGSESGEFEDRVDWTFKEVTDFKGKYPVYGIGLGSTYQGANILFGESIYAKEYGYYETEVGRIILEGGYILFFLRIALLLILLGYSAIPTAGRIVVLIFFLNNAVTFNVYQGIFFLIGLILVDRAYFIQQSKKRLVRS